MVEIAVAVIIHPGRRSDLIGRQGRGHRLEGAVPGIAQQHGNFDLPQILDEKIDILPTVIVHIGEIHRRQEAKAVRVVEKPFHLRKGAVIVLVECNKAGVGVRPRFTPEQHVRVAIVIHVTPVGVACIEVGSDFYSGEDTITVVAIDTPESMRKKIEVAIAVKIDPVKVERKLGIDIRHDVEKAQTVRLTKTGSR